MIIDYDLVIETCLDCLKEEDEFDDLLKQDAANLIRASILAVYEDPYYVSYGEVEKLLTGYNAGYGCWLSTVDRLVDEGLTKLPEEYSESIKSHIKGSYMMAKKFLFYIEGH